MKCKICDNINNNQMIDVKEMMFGYRDNFEYLECGNCGVLQLVTIPKDLYKYYPTNYYSYLNTKGFVNSVTNYLFYKVYNHIIYNKSILGKILLELDSEDIFFTTTCIGTLVKKLIDKGNVDKNSFILDVGCGSGEFLKIFEKLGFTNLYGVDINIGNDTENICFYESTFESYQTDLKFDLIFLKDSFEHMDNQHEIMEKLKSLLSNEGRIILTMPIKSYSYEKYHSNWFHIDTPRHLYIHTLESFQILLDSVGFNLEDTIFDGDFMSFVRSEEYKNNISLNDKKSYKESWKVFFKLTNIKKSIFSNFEIIRFKNKAKKLNNEDLGDHAIFIFK